VSIDGLRVPVQDDLSVVRLRESAKLVHNTSGDRPRDIVIVVWFSSLKVHGHKSGCFTTSALSITC
jgi:hypothetical protein